MEFVQATESDLPAIYAQMEENFIPEERRDFSDFARVWREGAYRLYHLVENGNRTGFMGVWQLKDFAFLEHFVVYGEYRNGGLGGRALELLLETCKSLCLECELPEKEMARRRVDFYLRHGMCVNGEKYRQPSYRKGGEGCDLLLMSYPSPLKDFDSAVREIYREVYGIDPDARR